MKARQLARIVTLLMIIGCVLSVPTFASKVHLKMWSYQTNFQQELEKRIKQYESQNPNVEIEQIMVTTDYWQKLLAAAAARKVPDIAYFHNQRISAFKDALEPFPEDLFPLQTMRKEYFAFDEACLIDGKWYFFPEGMMDGYIYYNKKMLKAAGISDKLASGMWTWDEARAIARKLTQRDAGGNIRVAGLAMKGGGAADPLWADIFYQMGGQWYSNDGKSVLWDTPPGQKATRLIWQLINEDKVDSQGFMNWTEAFPTGRAAMVPTRGWFGGNLDKNFPEMEFGVFPNPVPSKDTKVLGRNNYECGFAVMKAAPEANKREAFKFLKWLYSDDDWHVFINITQNRLPAKMSVWDDPRILADPELRVSRQQIPRTAFIGDMPPNAGWTALQNLVSRLYMGQSPDIALKEVAKEANQALKQTPAVWIVEHEWMKNVLKINH